MPTTNTSSLLADLKQHGIDISLERATLPERDAFIRARDALATCDDDKEAKKLLVTLIATRKAYGEVFHEWFASRYPHLLYERGEDKVFWLYDDDTGVYDELTFVEVRGLVMKELIAEDMRESARESFVRDVLARYRGVFVERGVAYDAFDTDPDWFHVGNGWVNTKSLEFVPHSPERLSRIKSRASYDAEAVCPTYDKFLDVDLRLKDSEVRVIDQFSGLLLTKDISHEKMLCIEGRSGSGKSTLVNIWTDVLGSFAVNKTLKDVSGDGARFVGASLTNRRLCWFDETDVKRAEMNNALGLLVSGKHIKVERKGINGEAIVPNTLHCVLTMNNLPMSAEDGLFRRLILIKLARESFHDEGTVDIRFGEKLQGELPGILNRMLRGITHLHKLGNFSVIEGHEQMIEEYKASANVIAEFLDTYFDPVPKWTEDVDVPISTNDMFSAYMADVGQTHGIQLTRQRFGRLLGNQPLAAFQCMRTARTNATRLWTGLRLKKGYEFSYSEFDDKARIVRTSGHGEGKIGKSDVW